MTRTGWRLCSKTWEIHTHIFHVVLDARERSDADDVSRSLVSLVHCAVVNQRIGVSGLGVLGPSQWLRPTFVFPSPFFVRDQAISLFGPATLV